MFVNITVYLGSNPGRKPVYTDAAVELGQWLGSNNHTLVYGGNKFGLMGKLADAAADNGAKVIGIIPEILKGIEIRHPRLTKLIEVETMLERKNHMIELGDAYIALPGGLGTLEEIAEVLSLMRIGTNPNPCVFYNVDGYYDLMRQFIDQMVSEKFLLQSDRDNILFSQSLEEIEAFILSYEFHPAQDEASLKKTNHPLN